MIPVCATDLPRRLSPGCLPPHLYKTGGNGGLAARLRFVAAFGTICAGETHGKPKDQSILIHAMNKKWMALLMLGSAVWIACVFVSLRYPGHLRREKVMPANFQTACDSIKDNCRKQQQAIRDFMSAINSIVEKSEASFIVATNGLANVRRRWGDSPDEKIQAVVADAKLECVMLEKRLIAAREARDRLMRASESQLAELDELIRIDITDMETLRGAGKSFHELFIKGQELRSSYGSYGHDKGQINRCFDSMKVHCNRIEERANTQIERFLRWGDRPITACP